MPDLAVWPRPERRSALICSAVPSPGRMTNGERQKSPFWKWVGLVALFHVVLISMFYWLYETASASKPPEQFISLLPPGDVVKGTPGLQEAHKLGPTTPAPTVRPASTPPTPPAIQPKPLPPKPVVKTETPPIDKPITPPKPKIKVDLTLVDGPTSAADKPKPKHHLKKPVVKPAEDTEAHEAAANPDSSGLSKEEIAEKLGEKMDASGVKNATKTGASGSIQFPSKSVLGLLPDDCPTGRRAVANSECGGRSDI